MQTLMSQGVPADKMGDIEKALDALFTAVADDKDDPELQTKADALADAVIAAKKADDPQEMPPKEALTGHFLKLAQDPWLKSWVKAKPAEALAALKVPVLALFGEKDTQVPGADHSVVLKKAFDGAKKKNGEIELIAGANHLFQSATTGKLSEYETIEETMQPTVIERITTWVKKQVGK